MISTIPHDALKAAAAALLAMANRYDHAGLPGQAALYREHAAVLAAETEPLSVVEHYGAQLAALQEMGGVAQGRLDRAECTCPSATFSHHPLCPVYREARA